MARTAVSSLRKGCWTELARFVFVLFGYYLVLKFFLAVPRDFLPGTTLALSVFGYFLVNALGARLRQAPELQAIKAAERRLAPREGHLTAVCGEVMPEGDLLRSPFGQIACCAYEYAVLRPERDAENMPVLTRIYRGFAFSPCTVHTPTGDFALAGLGFGSLPAPHEYGASNERVREAAEKHLRETSFSPDPSTNVNALVSAVGELFAEPRREGQRDYCKENSEIRDDDTFVEARLEPGQIVTAIGMFSQADRALLSKETAVLRVTNENLAEARKRMRRDASIALVFAIGLAAVSHGIFAFLYATGTFE